LGSGPDCVAIEYLARSMSTNATNDSDLLRQFENRTLPFEQWSHRMHVRIAYLYLRDFPFDDALLKMRSGIKAYNEANKVPESATSGYNETTTVAFMRLIHGTMTAYGKAFPTTDSASFCDTHPHLLSKQILRLFYSPERRMHPDAKSRFIEPDLAPLPKVRG